MSQAPIPIDISSNKDLLRLAEEVRSTNVPRVLKKDDEAVAVLMPVGKPLHPVAQDLLKRPQSGTRLLSLAGSMKHGPEDMATNKKNYL